MEKAVQAAGFLVRHLFASVVSVLFPIILTTVAYFILLIIAIIKDLYLGSPLALPLWMLIVTVISILYTSVLIFPSLAFAEFITRDLGRRQHLLQLPISFLIMAGLIFLVAYIIPAISTIRDDSIIQIFDSPHLFLLVLAIPLSLYWFASKAAYFGVHLIRKLLRKIGIIKGESITSRSLKH